MTDDLGEYHRQQAGKFKITGVDRGWTPANALQRAAYSPERPERNCRYDWHTFENGDYCSISSEFREVWNSARASAYAYGSRTGKRFKTAMGSHELLIWRQDDHVDLDHDPTLDRLKIPSAYLDTRGYVRCAYSHEVLQEAPNELASRLLLSMYLISGASTPQNYQLFLEDT